MISFPSLHFDDYFHQSFQSFDRVTPLLALDPASARPGLSLTLARLCQLQQSLALAMTSGDTVGNTISY